MSDTPPMEPVAEAELVAFHDWLTQLCLVLQTLALIVIAIALVVD